MFRLAYFTPLKPQKTGIADYSELLLKSIDEDLFKIDIFSSFDSPNNITSELKSSYDIFYYKQFPILKKENDYDLVIYNMGNNYNYHDYIYECLLKYPGLVILHDVRLGGFFCEKYLPRGGDESVLEEIIYGGGLEGLEAGKFILDKVKNGIGLELLYEYDYFLSNRVINESLGVIVHNWYAFRVVKKLNDKIPVFRLPHPIPDNYSLNVGADRKKILADLGVKKDTSFIISVLGFISESKYAFDVINVFRKLVALREDLNLILVFVGEDMIGLKESIDESLVSKVVFTGFVDDSKFYEILKVSDIIVNLRKYTAGETSGTLIKAMFFGKPVIVSNIGFFRELPIDTCIKIYNGRDIQDQLLDHIIKLIDNKELRNKIGQDARNYMLKNNNSYRVGKIFSAVVKYIVRRKNAYDLRFNAGKNYGYGRERVLKLINLNFHNVIDNVLSDFNLSSLSNLSNDEKLLIYDAYNEFFLE